MAFEGNRHHQKQQQAGSQTPEDRNGTNDLFRHSRRRPRPKLYQGRKPPGQQGRKREDSQAAGQEQDNEWAGQEEAERIGIYDTLLRKADCRA